MSELADLLRASGLTLCSAAWTAQEKGEGRKEQGDEAEPIVVEADEEPED
jgi:hypothetical protein